MAPGRALASSALWVLGGLTITIAGAIAVDRLAGAVTGLPGGLGTFGPSFAAAFVIGLIFARRPAEGVAIFLLLDLVALTAQRWFAIDLRVIDESTVVLLGSIVLLKQPTLLSRRPGLREGAIALIVVSGVLSSLVNSVPLEVWIPALLLLLKGVLFFYAVRALELEIAAVERTAAVILGVATVILVLGFVEFTNPSGFQAALGLPPYIVFRGDLPVVKSIFLHPALFAWLTAFTSLFLYARFAVFRSWWALGLGVLFSFGTVLSFRRRPLIGVPTALVGGALAEWRRAGWSRVGLRRFAIGAGVVGLVLVLMAPALRGTVERTLFEYLQQGDPLEILAEDPQLELVAPSQPRVALYLGGLAVARDYFPFGAGLGRFGSFISGVHYSPVYSQYGLDNVEGLRAERPVAITDTYWPMVLGETGVFGLLGMALLLGSILVSLWRLVSDASTRAVHAFVLGGLVVFLEGLLGSLTASTFVAAPIAFWVFAAAGVAEALARPREKQDHRWVAVRASSAAEPGDGR